MVLLVYHAVLPAAVERLLKHWKTLDKAAGEGDRLSQTLRECLRVRVPSGKKEGLRDRIGNPETASNETADFCHWLLSRSLCNREALLRRRPSIKVSANYNANTSTAPGNISSARSGKSYGGTRNAISSSRSSSGSKPIPISWQRERHCVQPSMIDDELAGRVVRAYRQFASAGLFDSGGDGATTTVISDTPGEYQHLNGLSITPSSPNTKIESKYNHQS